MIRGHHRFGPGFGGDRVTTRGIGYISAPRGPSLGEGRAAIGFHLYKRTRERETQRDHKQKVRPFLFSKGPKGRERQAHRGVSTQDDRSHNQWKADKDMKVQVGSMSIDVRETPRAQDNNSTTHNSHRRL